VDIIRTVYYIHGAELMKLIFAVLDVSSTVGLTRRYKTEGFYAFIYNKKGNCRVYSLVSKSISILRYAICMHIYTDAGL